MSDRLRECSLPVFSLQELRSSCFPVLFSPIDTLEKLEDLEDKVSHIAQGLRKDSVKVSPVNHASTLHMQVATYSTIYINTTSGYSMVMLSPIRMLHCNSAEQSGRW